MFEIDIGPFSFFRTAALDLVQHSDLLKGKLRGLVEENPLVNINSYEWEAAWLLITKFRYIKIWLSININNHFAEAWPVLFICSNIRVLEGNFSLQTLHFSSAGLLFFYCYAFFCFFNFAFPNFLYSVSSSSDYSG